MQRWKRKVIDATDNIKCKRKTLIRHVYDIADYKTLPEAIKKVSLSSRVYVCKPPHTQCSIHMDICSGSRKLNMSGFFMLWRLRKDSLSPLQYERT